MFIGVLFALCITLAIEPIISSFCKRLSFKVVLTSAVANIISNVSMNIVLNYITDSTAYYVVLYLWEVGTVILETLTIFFINKTHFWKTLLFVFIANLSSFVVGILLNEYVYFTSWGIPVVISVSLMLFALAMTLTAINDYVNKE